MNTVFVVQESPGKNILPAEGFGTLRPLLGAGERIWMDTATASDRLYNLLSGMGDNDYILPIGDPLAIGLVFVVAAAVTGGRFKVLKWDRQEGRYYIVQMDIPIFGDHK